ncbi:MAG: type II toxin-antitoxin system HigB family toxin [Candidatus Melainabacteria bacterium]|nr:type II toxin-antitoxin system HigB family toxin [Candidatus Melainabacteria bacterium]
MEIINENELHSFAKNHSNARRPLANWIDVTKAAAWKSFAEIRETFRSADYVKEQVVFNIGGNNYRLICSVDYSLQRVYVLEVMTHAEYDRWEA